MVRVQERKNAVRMRLAGKSYTSIQKSLGVSKSTLSNWLRDITLTQKQERQIKKSATEKRTESYIKTVRERRAKIIREYYEKEQRLLLPLTERDFLVAGLFLYLGEGAKSSWSHIAISNSNPEVIRFSIRWLTKILGIPRKKIKVLVHLYKDMNIEKEISFWAGVTGIPKNQFRKPYIKKTSSKKISYHTFGHGTCNVLAGSAIIKNRIMAGIKVVMDALNAPVAQLG